MNFSRTQTPIPRLSEQGNTVSNVSRKARALRRGCQVQRCGSEFSGSRGGQGAGRAEECASHRRSLHERNCTSSPCPVLWACARFLTAEGYSGSSKRSRCCSSRFVNDVNTTVRPVNAAFQCKVVAQSIQVAKANPFSLRGAAHLSHARVISDRRPSGGDQPRTAGANAHVPSVGHVRVRTLARAKL
jgi:hypothetical protein